MPYVNDEHYTVAEAWSAAIGRATADVAAVAAAAAVAVAAADTVHVGIIEQAGLAHGVRLPIATDFEAKRNVAGQQQRQLKPQLDVGWSAMCFDAAVRGEAGEIGGTESAVAKRKRSQNRAWSRGIGVCWQR